jgi:mutator protein MutT
MVHVIAAVIRRGDRYLLAKRPVGKRHGGLWEFPGGKLALAEDHLAGARRELAEELGIRVNRVGPVLFEAKDPGSDFLIQFVEVNADGEPQPFEHEALAWVSVSELAGYQLAPTDQLFSQTLG